MRPHPHSLLLMPSSMCERETAVGFPATLPGCGLVGSVWQLLPNHSERGGLNLKRLGDGARLLTGKLGLGSLSAEGKDGEVMRTHFRPHTPLLLVSPYPYCPSLSHPLSPRSSHYTPNYNSPPFLPPSPPPQHLTLASSDLAIMNQWTVPLEWNGGMEYWNDT